MKDVCPVCNNTRHVLVNGGWRRCSCLKNMKADRIMQEAQFPVTLVRVEASSFKMGNDKKKQLGEEILKRSKEWNSSPVFIFSQTPEKERAAAILTRYSAIKFPFVSTALFTKLDVVTEAFFAKDSEERTLKPEDVDILTLVIGNEIPNNAHRNILYNLLYTRLLNSKLTIICSSVPKDQLKPVYFDKVADIINENFSFFEC